MSWGEPKGPARDERSATPTRARQKVIIVQVPSEANAERLINMRVSDENANGWTVTQMKDHNGFLILLLAAGEGS